MARWYIKEDTFEDGPFTAGEMRKKVDAGEVMETTMVRKDSASKFLAARSYKGLIPEKLSRKSSNKSQEQSQHKKPENSATDELELDTNVDLGDKNDLKLDDDLDDFSNNDDGELELETNSDLDGDRDKIDSDLITNETEKAIANKDNADSHEQPKPSPSDIFDEHQDQNKDGPAHVQAPTVRTEMLKTDITTRMSNADSQLMRGLSKIYLIVALLALAFFIYLAI
ncbi:MAG: DUF4339 domain-containing protein [Planctomycetes bacterium]|nr:DUF4339 domain-containing protein [Planctomycetota bacterium]